MFPYKVAFLPNAHVVCEIRKRYQVTKEVTEN